MKPTLVVPVTLCRVRPAVHNTVQRRAIVHGGVISTSHTHYQLHFVKMLSLLVNSNSVTDSTQPHATRQVNLNESIIYTYLVGRSCDLDKQTARGSLGAGPRYLIFLKI